MNILIMGPQGSGKSTQAELLSKKLKLPLIQTGEILRRISLTSKGPAARRIKEAVEKGELVPVGIVSELINQRLAQADCQPGFVLDGYPRNWDQYQLFEKKLDKVFYIAISDQEAIKRLTLRGRHDDTPGLIQKRIDIYKKETRPLLEEFAKHHILEEIDGQRPVRIIQEDIVKKLGL